MKRLLAAVISILLIASISLSLVSCEDTDTAEYNVGDAAIPTDIIAVTTSPEKDNTTSSRVRKTTTSKMKRNIDSNLQDWLEKKLEANNFNGIARVSKNGKVICEAVNGTISTNSKKKIKKDTMFAIASCSKQFTAAGIMLLKQDGKLSVNDKLSKFFPKYKYGKKITVKNLLTMRSGIPDFLNEQSSFKKYDIKKTASEENNRKLTKKWILSQDLKFTPGGMYDYNNSNYFLLAEIIEEASGDSFADFMRKRFFEPLGMYDTDVNEELAYYDRLAVSDVDPSDLPGVDEKKQPLTIRVRGLNVGNGGLISTAEDMDKWLTSLRTNKILTRKSVKEMTTDHNKDWEHYGYGLKTIKKDGAVWHVGALDYYGSFTYTIPSKGYNFFAVTSDKKSMNTDIYTFAFDIINKTKK